MRIASGAFAIARREPDDDRKVLVAVRHIELAGRIAPNGRTNGRIDIAWSEPVTAGAGTIDIDLYSGLAERCKHRKIGDPAHGGQHFLDLVCRLGEGFKIIAEQLDRIFAFYAGDGLGHVVLQVLREVKLNADEF